MNEVPSIPYPPCFLTVCVLKGVGRENSFLSLYCSEKEPIANSFVRFVFVDWLHRRCYLSTQRAVNQVHPSAGVPARSTLVVTFSSPILSRICCVSSCCSEEGTHDGCGNLRSTGLRSIEGIYSLCHRDKCEATAAVCSPSLLNVVPSSKNPTSNFHHSLHFLSPVNPLSPSLFVRWRPHDRSTHTLFE